MNVKRGLYSKLLYRFSIKLSACVITNNAKYMTVSKNELNRTRQETSLIYKIVSNAIHCVNCWHANNTNISWNWMFLVHNKTVFTPEHFTSIVTVIIERNDDSSWMKLFVAIHCVNYWHSENIPKPFTLKIFPHNRLNNNRMQWWIIIDEVVWLNLHKQQGHESFLELNTPYVQVSIYS